MKQSLTEISIIRRTFLLRHAKNATVEYYLDVTNTVLLSIYHEFGQYLTLIGVLRFQTLIQVKPHISFLTLYIDV
jgi:hypothetical protein